MDSRFIILLYLINAFYCYSIEDHSDYFLDYFLLSDRRNWGVAAAADHGILHLQGIVVQNLVEVVEQCSVSRYVAGFAVVVEVEEDDEEAAVAAVDFDSQNGLNYSLE